MDLEGNIVYDLTKNNIGLVEVLTDRDKNRNHFSYSNIQSAVFLHTYCWKRVNMIKGKIQAESLWWFLAVYGIGINLIPLKDDSTEYNINEPLSQYDDRIWMIQNPETNKMNYDRIDKRLEQMLSRYDEWKDNFQIEYWIQR
jgi:hypothetical protein